MSGKKGNPSSGSSAANVDACGQGKHDFVDNGRTQTVTDSNGVVLETKGQTCSNCPAQIWVSA